MKDKRKLILAIVIILIAVAGLLHATKQFFMLQDTCFPASIAFLWLIPYALAIVVCLIVGGIIIHKRKK